MHIHGCGQHWCIHAVSGLEVLAAEEVMATPGCSDVYALVGRVIFFAGELPLEHHLRGLRSALRLSLLCWATPTPRMPGEDVKGTGSVTSANDAERAARAEEVCTAGDALARTQLWESHFTELLLVHALPQMATAEKAWRAAVGMAAGGSIRFRVTVRRGGERSAACGASSQRMAAELGRLCTELLGWTVDLHAFELEVLLQWNEDQVVLELPVTNRYVQGEAALAERTYLRGGMQGPVAWSLAALTRLPPGGILLDPMVGKGTVPIEASFLYPDAAGFIGADADSTQLDVAAENLARASDEQRCAAARAHGRWAASRVALVHGDATRLPLGARSVDGVVCDLPFGRRHTSELGLPSLYERAIGEMARVLRDGGLAVVFTTLRALASRLFTAEPTWMPVGRHEVQFGSLKAYVLVCRRQPPLLCTPPLALSARDVAAGGAHAASTSGERQAEVHAHANAHATAHAHAHARGSENLRQASAADTQAAPDAKGEGERVAALARLIEATARKRRHAGNGRGARRGPMVKRPLMLHGRPFALPVRAAAVSIGPPAVPSPPLLPIPPWPPGAATPNMHEMASLEAHANLSHEIAPPSAGDDISTSDEPTLVPCPWLWIAMAPAEDVAAELQAVGRQPQRHREALLRDLFERPWPCDFEGAGGWRAVESALCHVQRDADTLGG